MKTIWIVTVDGWPFQEAFLTESAALAAASVIDGHGNRTARTWDITIPDPE